MRDIVYDNGTVCISVVHGSERLIPFLTGRIPDLEFDGGVIVQSDGLGKEGGSDCRLPIVVKLILEDRRQQG